MAGSSSGGGVGIPLRTELASGGFPICFDTRSLSPDAEARYEGRRQARAKTLEGDDVEGRRRGVSYRRQSDRPIEIDATGDDGTAEAGAGEVGAGERGAVQIRAEEN